MSIDLNGSSQYLERDEAPVTAYPFSISMWVDCDALADTMTAMYIGDKDTNPGWWMLRTTAADYGEFVAYPDGGSVRTATTTTQLSVDTWHNLVVIASSATSRSIYLDGAGVGSSIDAATPLLADRISIGRAGKLTPADYFNGQVAEAAIANAAWNAAAIANAASGLYPDELPDVVAAWHFNDNTDLSDLIGAYDLTAFGTPANGGSHPTMHSGADGLSIPIVMSIYAQQ